MPGRVLRQGQTVAQPQVLGDADSGPGERLATDLAVVVPHSDAPAAKFSQIIHFLPAVSFLQVRGEASHGEQGPLAELAAVLAAIEPLLSTGAGTGTLHHFSRLPFLSVRLLVLQDGDLMDSLQMVVDVDGCC